jgi:endonuclease YncB( thermonuclease family)
VQVKLRDALMRMRIRTGIVNVHSSLYVKLLPSSSSIILRRFRRLITPQTAKSTLRARWQIHTAMKSTLTAILCCLAIVTTSSAQAQTQPASVDAVVLDVIDGDTIRVRIDDREETVRYIGYDAPEMGRKPQCYAAESTAANRTLVDGQTVKLVKDRSERDRNKRLLRHVYLPDGALITERLAEDGNGFARRYAPDIAQQPLIVNAQTSAIREKVGLWAACTVNRARTRTAFKPQPRPAAQQPPSAPASASQGLTSQPASDAQQPAPAAQPAPQQPAAPAQDARANCDPSYPTICIPVNSADLDCPDIADRRFPVVGADPHRFDGDNDGIGCESG